MIWTNVLVTVSSDTNRLIYTFLSWWSAALNKLQHTSSAVSHSWASRIKCTDNFFPFMHAFNISSLVFYLRSCPFYYTLKGEHFVAVFFDTDLIMWWITCTANIALSHIRKYQKPVRFCGFCEHSLLTVHSVLLWFPPSLCFAITSTSHYQSHIRVSLHSSCLIWLYFHEC